MGSVCCMGCSLPLSPCLSLLYSSLFYISFTIQPAFFPLWSKTPQCFQSLLQIFCELSLIAVTCPWTLFISIESFGDRMTWYGTLYCSTVLHLAPFFSLCLSASCDYFWILLHSEQRIFMSLQCINPNFWMTVVNLEANKVTQIIPSRMCITWHCVFGQCFCLRWGIAQQNTFFSPVWKLSQN